MDTPAGSTTASETDLRELPFEVLNLISVGAGALLGFSPNEGWGEHAGGELSEGEVYHPECRTCRAAQWLDTTQAELRRRDEGDEKEPAECAPSENAGTLWA